MSACDILFCLRPFHFIIVAVYDTKTMYGVEMCMNTRMQSGIRAVRRWPGSQYPLWATGTKRSCLWHNLLDATTTVFLRNVVVEAMGASMRTVTVKLWTQTATYEVLDRSLLSIRHKMLPIRTYECMLWLLSPAVFATERSHVYYFIGMRWPKGDKIPATSLRTAQICQHPFVRALRAHFRRLRICRV